MSVVRLECPSPRITLLLAPMVVRRPCPPFLPISAASAAATDVIAPLMVPSYRPRILYALYFGQLPRYCQNARECVLRRVNLYLCSNFVKLVLAPAAEAAALRDPHNSFFINSHS